jgi:hypothetical protein
MDPIPAIQARADDTLSGVEGAEEAAILARLDAFGQSLAAKRKEAILHRASCGIEGFWRVDEEQYAGIDDHNRDEERGGGSAWTSRPAGMEQAGTGDTQSRIFPNITQPYCDMASGRFSDMVVPSDEANFELVPPPIPDLQAIAGGMVPPDMQQHLAQNVTDTQQQQLIRQNLQAQAQAMLKDAADGAKAAQDRIEGWLQGCNFHGEVRQVIDDVVGIGTGVIKGPIPVRRRSVSIVDDVQADPGAAQGQGVLHQLLGHVKRAVGAMQPAAKKLVIEEKIEPASVWVSPWCIYPDPACGENIHNGSYIWEVDYITRKKLTDLKGGEGPTKYLDTQIDRVLTEGPDKNVADIDRGRRHEEDTKRDSPDRFQIWYMYGAVGRDEMLAAGCQCEEHDLVHAMVTMVNGHVIKADLNVLDSGDFPYDLMPLKKRKGMPWGTGLARMMRTPQRLLTAASRRLADNAGLSAGAQIVISHDVTPADGSYTLTANKVWRLKSGSDINDVQKAMQFFEIPSRQADLMAIIQYALNLCERVTGMPVLLQGQLGESRNQPLGVVTIQNNNGNTLLRRMAKMFDDSITSPHIGRYYKFLLQYGENDAEKRNLQIEARGSSALIERQLQSQELPQMFQLATNPLSGLDPKKTAAELVKSRNFDVRRFQYDSSEWEKIVQNMSQKGGDPRLAVAQLKAQMDEKLKTLELQFQQQEGQKDRDNAFAIKMLDEKLQSAELSSVERQVLDKLRAELASVVIKVNAEKQLAGAQMGVDLHRHHNPSAEALLPPVEPPGKAQPGKSFYQ